MKSEEKPVVYLVVLNRDEIIGEFKMEDDAHLFAYICALHGDPGDNFEIYVTKAGFEVAKEEV